jgi:tetratricopeptide (TPR) repeat protein
MTRDTLLELRRAGRHDEALALALELAAQAPHDAPLQFEAACLCDYHGREAEAVPLYVNALRGELSPEDRRSAYLGLGSTYRALGRYAEAKSTLLEGSARFPQACEIAVFLAMALHNLGEHKQAIELLLRLIATTSSDRAIQDYRRAIEFYAEDIDRSW